MKQRRLYSAAFALLAGCAAPPPAAQPTATQHAPAPPAAPLPTAAGAVDPPTDPLGPKPEVALPPPFTPPSPAVFVSANGLHVWLLERHALPLVSVALTVPYGSASDPPRLGGLAHATVSMLEEGAGSRGSLELAGAIDLLGATLETRAGVDSSSVALKVLKRNLAPALDLFGDVVTRPRFDPKEWAHAHELWLNGLTARTSQPSAVLQVAITASLFPEGHPYAHPADGTVESAKRVSLADVKRFYGSAWRPDQATLVVVGDVTRAELEALLTHSLAAWTAPKGAAPKVVVPPAPPAAVEGNGLRVVLVDRTDAPQSMIAFVRPAVAASSPDAPLLSRANTALGGSFTSRLNQDLREEHGWSYGAKSAVRALRGTGFEMARAAVQTAHTAEALTALLNDVRDFGAAGLTDEEMTKTRLYDRSELVEAFETDVAATSVLLRDAVLGLGPDFESKASIARESATRAQLGEIAAKYFDTKPGFVVIVGPRAQIEAQLTLAHLAPTEFRDAEGARVVGAPKSKGGSVR